MTTKTEQSHYSNQEILKALHFESLYTDTDIEKTFGRDGWHKIAEKHPNGTQGETVALEHFAQGEALEVTQETFAKILDYLRQEEYKRQGEDYYDTLARRNLMQLIERANERASYPLDHYEY